MFRGDSYVDDPNFANINSKPGYNHLRFNVQDINGIDKSGNNHDSPQNQNNKNPLKVYRAKQYITPE